MSQPYDLVMVTLTDEQIAKANVVNGERRRIANALFGGLYRQLFGTENQCWKDCATRRGKVPELFERAYEAGTVECEVFENDFDSASGLVLVLIDGR